MTTRKKRIRRIVNIALTIVCVSILYGGYRFFNPYDEVAVEFQGLPPDTNFVCLVAETDGGLRAMDWSLAKVFPFTTHPDECVASEPFRGETTHQGKVRWIFSPRIGVLCRTTGSEWKVVWIDAADVKLENRSFLFGGGSIEINVANADERQAISDEQLRGLGMNYRLTEDEDQ